LGNVVCRAYDRSAEAGRELSKAGEAQESGRQAMRSSRSGPAERRSGTHASMKPRMSRTVWVRLTLATSRVPSPSRIWMLVVGWARSTANLVSFAGSAAAAGAAAEVEPPAVGKAPGTAFDDEEDDDVTPGTGAPSRLPAGAVVSGSAAHSRDRQITESSGDVPAPSNGPRGGGGGGT